jgi:Tol biopolymer transport system component
MSIALLISMIIGLLAPAPATTRASDVAFIVLTRDGQLVRNDGAPSAKNLRGLETIASCPTLSDIVATRGNEILLVPLDRDVEPKVLLKHTAPVRFAELSPDGEFLVFSSNENDGWQVLLAERDAQGEFSQVRRTIAGYAPSFSHGGRFIYFEQGDKGLIKFEIRSGRWSEFLPDYRRAHTVRCSRDGKWIAFSMNRALYLCDTSDNSVRQLSDGDSYDRFASFAGDDVVFVREMRDGKQQGVAMRNDGTNTRVLYEGDVMLVAALPVVK